MSEESADAIRECFGRYQVLDSINQKKAKWERGDALEAMEGVYSAVDEMARTMGKDVEPGDDIAWSIKRIADAIERIADKIAPATGGG